MQFCPHRRRQPPAVIIVALIDILIVLLIFLMVTTTFRHQPALKLALPESSQAKETGASEDALLEISVDSKGRLRLGADATPVTIERFRERLLAEIARRPDVKLAIAADKQAPFGEIVKVMDVAKAANIKSVNAYTEKTRTQ